MYVESIKIKKTSESEWERGYYIGDTDNSKKSVFLDKDYKPIERDSCGILQLWDYHTDTDRWIQFRCDD